MRSLIRSRIRRDDAGATIVLVSLMMVVLLGMGALVVDVGQLYAERRELQNGADAAALAVAQDCAGGDCRDETTTADTYADDNAHDGKAAVDEVCGSGPGLTPCATPTANVPASDWVKVTTVTPDDDKVDFVFAPILGHDAGTVDATAVAAWGAVGRATTLPLTFSECEYAELGGDVDAGTFPSGLNYIYFHDTTERRHVPGGPVRCRPPRRLRLARQLGRLWRRCHGRRLGRRQARQRGAQRLRAVRLAVRRGAGPHIRQRERPQRLERRSTTSPASPASASPATGSPETSGRTAFPCGPKPGGGTTYICGEFTRVVTTGEIGTGPDYGARAVQMIG